MNCHTADGNAVDGCARNRAIFVFEPFEARCLLSAASPAALIHEMTSVDGSTSVQVDAQYSDRASSQSESNSAFGGESSKNPRVAMTFGSESESPTSPSPAHSESSASEISSSEDQTVSETPGQSSGSKQSASVSAPASGEDSSEDSTDSPMVSRTSPPSSERLERPTKANAPIAGSTTSTTANQPAGEEITAPLTPAENGSAGISLLQRASTPTTIPGAADTASPSDSLRGGLISAIADLTTSVSAAVASTSSQVIATNIAANVVLDRVEMLLPHESNVASSLPRLFSAVSVIDQVVVASARQIDRVIAMPFTFSNGTSLSPLFSTRQIYHFARLGNPAVLLDESITALIGDLTASPGLKAHNSTRSRAFLVTALVVAADVVALRYLRRRSVTPPLRV